MIELVIIEHFILHVLGVDNVSGYWYALWSGFFGDMTILAVPFVILRKNNCHAKGCPRIGRHKVDGTNYVVCSKHHPDDHKTVEEIHTLWRAHKEKTEAQADDTVTKDA